MEDFVYRKKVVAFSGTTGKVISSNKFSSTDFSASGGGGEISSSGASYNPLSVNASSNVNHEFWIRKENGEESSVQLSEGDIPLKEGQEVTIFTASRTDQQDSFYAILLNHNANDYWFMNRTKRLNKYLSLEHGSHAPLFIALLMPFFIYDVYDRGFGSSNPVLYLLIFCFAVYALITHYTKDPIAHESGMDNLRVHGSSIILCTLAISFLYSVFGDSLFAYFIVPLGYLKGYLIFVKYRQKNLERALADHLNRNAKKSLNEARQGP